MKTMYSLIIDTAYANGVIALFLNDVLISEVVLKGNVQNSTILAQEVQSLLDEKKIGAEQVKELIVGVGPGSYTGIRVAVSFAAGFAAAFPIPIVPVCSLAGFLSGLHVKEAVLADAKMGGAYYYALNEKGDWQASLLSSSGIEIISLNQGNLFVVGSEQFFLKINSFKSKTRELRHVQEPSSLQLLQHAKRKKQVMPPQIPELLYLRASQAEIEKRQR